MQGTLCSSSPACWLLLLLLASLSGCDPPAQLSSQAVIAAQPRRLKPPQTVPPDRRILLQRPRRNIFAQQICQIFLLSLRLTTLLCNRTMLALSESNATWHISPSISLR